MQQLLLGTAARVVGRGYLTSDHISTATGLDPAFTISKNGGNFANPAVGASVMTEIEATGWYYFALGTGDTDTLGPLIVRGTHASPAMDNIEVVFQVVAAVTAANVTQYLGHTMTNTGTQIADAFQTMFDVASPVFTCASVNQVQDNATTAEIKTALETGMTFATLSVTGQLDAGNVLVDGTTVLTGNVTHSGTTTHTGQVFYSDGIAITGSTGGRHAIAATGNGAGAGMILTGGNAAPGLYCVASAMSGILADGAGTNKAGIECTGPSGLRAVGSVAGIFGTSGTAAGIGMSLLGNTTGEGLKVLGGNNASGVTATAGGGNNQGVYSLGTGSGHGWQSVGGTTGSGITAAGTGTGHGIRAVSGNGATGDGINATSASTAGNGLKLTGTGAGFGLNGSLADGIITAASIANGAIDNATFAADVGSTAAATNIISQAVELVIKENNLDHLMKTAKDTNWATTITKESVIDLMTSKDTSQTFQRSEDSLEAVRDRGDAAWLTGAGAAADAACFPTAVTKVVGGTLSGDHTNLVNINASYCSLQETTTTTLLELNVAFAATAGSLAVGLRVWGYYSGSQTHYIRVQALDQTGGTIYEDIGTMPNASIVTNYVYDLGPNHIKSDGTVNIKFLHSPPGTGITSHYLYLDKVYVSTISPVINLTAAQVVDAWETQSQADPTGFHVNVMEINGTAQTAGDVGVKTGFALSATGLDAVAKTSDGAKAISDAVWDEVLHTDHEVASSASVLLQTAGTGADAATIADAVWNEVLHTDHEVASSASVLVQSIADDASAVHTAIDDGTSGLAALHTDLATAATSASEANAHAHAIDLQTAKLAFTVTNKVDANIKSVNDITVDGSGTTLDPWGPA